MWFQIRIALSTISASLSCQCQMAGSVFTKSAAICYADRPQRYSALSSSALKMCSPAHQLWSQCSSQTGVIRGFESIHPIRTNQLVQLTPTLVSTSRKRTERDCTIKHGPNGKGPRMLLSFSDRHVHVFPLALINKGDKKI